MFVRLRIQAHEALKQYMLNSHAPLNEKTAKLIYAIIAEAETDEGFANVFDFECAKLFNEQTAEEYDDLIALINEMPPELEDFLKKSGLLDEIEEEED